jgi:hypothetical protein
MDDNNDTGGSDSSGESNVGEDESPYMPLINVGPTIAHYYGDYVRQIFLVAAAIMLISAPFLIDRAPALLPFEIGGAIVLVCLAALTNPKKILILVADVVAAGVGVVVFESLAIAAYASGNWIAFVGMEAVSIGFLFALYFSLKTVRAMMYGQIGHETTYGEFPDRD